jgi:hypothetical protein
VHDTVRDPAGDVPLRRHGVEMAGEHDERPARPGAVEDRLAGRIVGVERDGLGDVRRSLLLVRALGCDVDEVERPRARSGPFRGILGR